MEDFRASDGTKIAYERQGEGPALVLVHGSLIDHSEWEFVLPLLAAHFQVYAIDRRGHGSSDPYRPDHTLEREVQDLVEFVAALGKPAHLLGHSYGARLALHAALQLPLVHKMVLYEPSSFEPLPGDAKRSLETCQAAGDCEGLVTVALRDMVMRLSPQQWQAVAEPLRTSRLWRWALANALSIPAELLATEGYRFDAEVFAELASPTLLLLGSESPPEMLDIALKVKRALRRAVIRFLQGQGHAAMLMVPELFSAEVVQFLEA